MEWFKHLTDMQNLKNRRIRQLEIEESFDKYLTNNVDKCPQKIIKYLILNREISRNRSKEMYNCSIFDYHTKIEQNLKDFDSIYLKYSKSIPDCSTIDSLITDMEKLYYV